MGKSSGVQELLSDRELNEEISKVAYDLYKRRGMAGGYDVEDWLKAEEIVKEQYKKLKRNEVDLMSEVANKKAERAAARRKKKAE